MAHGEDGEGEEEEEGQGADLVHRDTQSHDRAPGNAELFEFSQYCLINEFETRTSMIVTLFIANTELFLNTEQAPFSFT